VDDFASMSERLIDVKVERLWPKRVRERSVKRTLDELRKIADELEGSAWMFKKRSRPS
jgi:hypothetical protein